MILDRLVNHLNSLKHQNEIHFQMVNRITVKSSVAQFLHVLFLENFIYSYDVREIRKQFILRVATRLDGVGISRIKKITKVHTKNRVTCYSSEDLRKLQNMSTSSFIVSTSRGLTTARQAVVHGIGGVILYKIN